MEISVNELSGRLLDWFVADSLGIDLNFKMMPMGVDGNRVSFSPTHPINAVPEYHSSWMLAGPLIEKFNISIVCGKGGEYYCYGFLGIGDYHYVDLYPEHDSDAHGDDPLTTICRTAVASRHGKAVNVPSGLQHLAASLDIINDDNHSQKMGPS
ncbi:TPA: DUF2591 domain-containing protein [Klebsiella quasipneumoniae]|nr:DUF2591 domain-containing protein [Klebsiella quasipneumoniae]